MTLKINTLNTVRFKREIHQHTSHICLHKSRCYKIIRVSGKLALEIKLPQIAPGIESLLA